MPRTDLYDYERRIRVILLEAHADGWVLEHVATMAAKCARITVQNREYNRRLEEVSSA